MTAPVIEVRELTKHFGARRALDSLSFAVEAGGVVGFLGVNGAGKSTTMRILAGYLPPSAGSARVCGLDVVADSLATRARIGYLPENNPLYPEMRVDEYLRFRARLKGLARKRRAGAVADAIEACCLGESATRIIGQLSKGYRQRVGLADCLLTEAPLLILDEPTVGLDPNQARETRRLIARIGERRTVFLSTHILSDVETLCRGVVIIHQGRLVTVDTPKSLCARVTVPRRYRIEADGPPAEMERALASVAGVAAVTALDRTADTAVFAVEGRPGAEPRGAVLAAFGSAGWIVRAVEADPVRLEDIFAHLTEGVA